VTRVATLLAAALAVCTCGPPRTVATVPPPPAAVSSVDRLRADLTAVFTDPQFERSLWSVLVVPSDEPAPVFTLNAAKLMMPASTMKIVTAASAGELLGWDHRFETSVVTTAPLDRGVLRGDLVVIGGGDPSISERSDVPGTLRTIASRVREAGITHIEGGVIGHDDLFDDRGFGDGWTLDNIPYGYSAPVSALEYNEGSVDLVIRAGAESGMPVSISVRPEGSGLDVENRLVTVAESGSGALTLQRSPGSSHVVVQGQIPARALPFVRTASVDNPTRFFASALRHALTAAGVGVAGDAIDIDELQTKPDLTAARVLAMHRSPPLRQLVSSMMKVSQNQYAEMLLRYLGTSRSSADAPATEAIGEPNSRAGAKRALEVLQAWNISDDSLVIADGSGLSRYNYVTSEALVRVLQIMRSDAKHASAFVESLPIAGRDGTLSRRLAGTAAEGKVRAKTGTVDNVRAISGYVETADGETLLFSMIANNFTTSAAVIDAAADNALVRLATFSRR
jgi:D-alanyl-D-alanine carboxypeptidase/D-alanyl-D-alanine-endopeptidase (penicillin-binding protein 4)